jgi:hypothetical protein
VWTVYVRMPVAVALGLSTTPRAERLRAHRRRRSPGAAPASGLVRACVDATTGGGARGRPAGARCTWRSRTDTRRQGLADRPRGDGHRRRHRPGLTCDATRVGGPRPWSTSATSPAPSQATAPPARRTDRDHRLPFPSARRPRRTCRTSGRRWHRAKHAGCARGRAPTERSSGTAPGGGGGRSPPLRPPPEGDNRRRRCLRATLPPLPDADGELTAPWRQRQERLAAPGARA